MDTFTLRNKRKALEALKILVLMDPSELKFIDFGVCLNLSAVCEDTHEGTFGYEIVEAYSPSWEHTTGNPEFPVPREAGVPLWEGSQLDLRRDLMLHIIFKLTEELKDTKLVKGNRL